MTLIDITDTINRLLESTEGMKAVLYLWLQAHCPGFVIPGVSQSVLNAANLLDRGTAKDPATTSFLSAAFPSGTSWQDAQLLRPSCPHCGQRVEVIPNQEAPWIHRDNPCGTLVTRENLTIEPSGVLVE